MSRAICEKCNKGLKTHDLERAKSVCCLVFPKKRILFLKITQFKVYGIGHKKKLQQIISKIVICQKKSNCVMYMLNSNTKYTKASEHLGFLAFTTLFQ